MEKVDPYNLLREIGAIIKGHFELASGLHTPLYVDKRAAIKDRLAAENLCAMLSSL